MTARTNIERALRHVGLWNLLLPESIEDGPDRIRAVFTPEFRRRVCAEFRRDPWMPDQKAHPGALESWRERWAVKPCLQVCFCANGTADIDLDLASPAGEDAASPVIHFIEWAWHKLAGSKSNQRRIARWLNRRFKEAA